MLQLAQNDGVAEVNIGRGGIHAEVGAQRFAGFCGLFEPRLQVLFADDFSRAFPQVGQLLVNGFEFCQRHSALLRGMTETSQSKCSSCWSQSIAWGKVWRTAEVLYLGAAANRDDRDH